jgi:hypothetical protein
MPISDAFVPPMTLKRRLHRVRRTVRRSLAALRSKNSVNDALAANPLMFAEKTYNTAHPNYEPELARCYSGRIHNLDCANDNSLFREIRQLARRGTVPNRAWRQILRDAMERDRYVLPRLRSHL